MSSATETPAPTPSATPGPVLLDTCPLCWVIAGRVGLGLVVLVSAMVAWSKRHTIAAAWRGMWKASRADAVRDLERRRGSASTADTGDWAREEWRWVEADDGLAGRRHDDEEPQEDEERATAPPYEPPTEGRGEPG
jgi:hypothetical protein